ncbi:spore coat protein [Bacillus vallismortis]|uniref:spore coat protein n=1 Tax=Bacillus vallismortis TaxID=72361 RepID=UPI00227FE676|nr:spore coat protein [Bacillus vallismortis]MCY8309386.1 spore coat protein [Bacillus vallismortis]MCY8598893.1 spore coat protein [Bacillus vallismortis]
MNQQNQKISNPQTPVPTTPEMNDRDFINELLTTEKYMTTAYCTALNELSHESLYQDIQAIFDESQKTQRKLYDLMFQYGWYSVEAEDAQKLQKSYQKFDKTIQQQSPYQQ